VIVCAGLTGVTSPAAIAASGATSRCPAPPALPHDLEIARYYTPGSNDRVDPKRKARTEAKLAQTKQTLRALTRFADHAWQSPTDAGRARAGRCGTAWLQSFARARAYLGRMVSKQAEYQRKWDFATLAIAHLKLKRAPAAPLAGEAHGEIENWLSALAERAEAFQRAPGRVANNHAYWLALGLAALAEATDDDAMRRRVRADVVRAARAVAADGTLPLELDRGQRALHYHVFSVMPLVALNEFARAREDDWFALEGRAFDRLTAVTVAGLVAPVIFDRLAGARQERPVNRRAGWATLYAWRNPKVRIPPKLTRKKRHRLLGGDVRVLVAALNRR